MKTSLNLLTRDGGVYVSFRPELSPALYAELLELAKRPNSDQELRDTLVKWSQFNGLSVTFEEMPHGSLQ